MPSGSIWDETRRMRGDHRRLADRVDELEAHMKALDQRIKDVLEKKPVPKKRAVKK